MGDLLTALLALKEQYLFDLISREHYLRACYEETQKFRKTKILTDNTDLLYAILKMENACNTEELDIRDANVISVTSIIEEIKSLFITHLAFPPEDKGGMLRIPLSVVEFCYNQIKEENNLSHACKKNLDSMLGLIFMLKGKEAEKFILDQLDNLKRARNLLTICTPDKGDVSELLEALDTLLVKSGYKEYSLATDDSFVNFVRA